MTDKKDEPLVRGSLKHLQTQATDSRAYTSETRERLAAVFEAGRSLAPSAARHELMQGIEMVHARTYVLNGTKYDELGKTIRFLLDVLTDHLKSGTLTFGVKTESATIRTLEAKLKAALEAESRLRVACVQTQNMTRGKRTTDVLASMIHDYMKNALHASDEALATIRLLDHKPSPPDYQHDDFPPCGRCGKSSCLGNCPTSQ